MKALSGWVMQLWLLTFFFFFGVQYCKSQREKFLAGDMSWLLPAAGCQLGGSGPPRADALAFKGQQVCPARGSMDQDLPREPTGCWLGHEQSWEKSLSMAMFSAQPPI